MVAANDNRPRRPRNRHAASPVNDARANVTLTSDDARSATEVSSYTYTGGDSRGETVVTYTMVTDDLGDHVEVRRGEAVIIGPLIAEVLEQLRAKVANDN